MTVIFFKPSSPVSQSVHVPYFVEVFAGHFTCNLPRNKPLWGFLPLLILKCRISPASLQVWQLDMLYYMHVIRNLVRIHTNGHKIIDIYIL